MIFNSILKILLILLICIHRSNIGTTSSRTSEHVTILNQDLPYIYTENIGFRLLCFNTH